MSTIDQTGDDGNSTDEPSGDVKGEEAGTAAPTIEDAVPTEQGGPAPVEGASTSNGWEEEPPRSGEAARAPVEQHDPEILRGLTALALLRATINEHGLSAKLEGALSTLDTAIRRASSERAAGGGDEPPTSEERRTEGEHDDEPTTARTLNPTGSMLGFRLNDWRMLVSLEDAADRDVSGREVIRCMVLTKEEEARALKEADDGLSNAAATVIGGLPMIHPSA